MSQTVSSQNNEKIRVVLMLLDKFIETEKKKKDSYERAKLRQN